MGEHDCVGCEGDDEEELEMKTWEEAKKEISEYLEENLDAPDFSNEIHDNAAEAILGLLEYGTLEEQVVVKERNEQINRFREALRKVRGEDARMNLAIEAARIFDKQIYMEEAWFSHWDIKWAMKMVKEERKNLLLLVMRLDDVERY